MTVFLCIQTAKLIPPERQYVTADMRVLDHFQNYVQETGDCPPSCIARRPSYRRLGVPNSSFQMRLMLFVGLLWCAVAGIDGREMEIERLKRVRHDKDNIARVFGRKHSHTDVVQNITLSFKTLPCLLVPLGYPTMLPSLHGAWMVTARPTTARCVYYLHDVIFWRLCRVVCQK